MTIKERIAKFADLASQLEFDEKENILPGQLEYYDNATNIWQQSEILYLKSLYNAIVENNHGYRLKPQPEYVPFESWEEVYENAYNPWALWVEFENSQYLLTGICSFPSVQVKGLWGNFEVAFKELKFYNPVTKETKPFGKVKKC